MSQREKFIRLFIPFFLLAVVFVMIEALRPYAIAPVALFWLAFFGWDAWDKKKNGHREEESD